ncbi:MAG: tetratricopeptide repeat protein [Candidatus Obscuribacterales bacterium]|nr:tetratricopeptide repeat protein [Candidatus Obscuribacterales bacterium]
MKYKLFSTLLIAVHLVLTISPVQGETFEAVDKIELKQLLLKAKALSFSGHPAAAIPTYKQVLAKDPNNAEAFAGLGWVYYQSGKASEAISSERRAITLDPLSAEPHYFLAAIYFSQKHYQTAQNERIKAAELAKNRPCNCGHVSELSKSNQ